MSRWFRSEPSIFEAVNPYLSEEATAPSEIGYLTYYADAQCKKDITLVSPFLSGVQYTVPSLKGIANDPTNCKQNVACVIQSDSPQCQAAGGGANMASDTVSRSITTPDENGCEILGEAVPLCDCYESTSAPGCHYKFITANDFTKLVNAPGFAKAGFAMDEEDNFCEGFKKEKQCDRKGGDACVWKEDGCVPNGGLLGRIGFDIEANEAVVGAEAIGQQSNSSNGMTDMPLSSAVMMLLSLYYALKW